MLQYLHVVLSATGVLKAVLASSLHILQDGCEVLIGSDADDRLILSNIFVQDHETGVYAEPELIGDIPQIAQRYAPEASWALDKL